MGKSVTMIERYYGRPRVLAGIEYQTARPRKASTTPATVTTATSAGDLVPDGAVDPTPALQADED